MRASFLSSFRSLWEEDWVESRTRLTRAAESHHPYQTGAKCLFQVGRGLCQGALRPSFGG